LTKTSRFITLPRGVDASRGQANNILQSMGNCDEQVRKGAVESYRLELPEALGQCYGYEWLQRYGTLPSMSVQQNAAYTTLNPLTKEGIVTLWEERSPSGPSRRWYRLTEFGRTGLKQMRLFMSGLHRSLELLRNAPEEGKKQSSIHKL